MTAFAVLAWAKANPKLIGVLLAILAIGIVACRIEQHGADRAMEKVNEQNLESRTGAIEGARNVDDCYRAGGVWSTRTGNCSRN